MSNKESIGGEQAYQHTIEEACAEEESRYQKFLEALLKGSVVKDA